MAWTRKNLNPNVGFGSFCDISAAFADVRFGAVSGLPSRELALPGCAKSGYLRLVLLVCSWWARSARLNRRQQRSFFDARGSVGDKLAEDWVEYDRFKLLSQLGAIAK